MREPNESQKLLAKVCGLEEVPKLWLKCHPFKFTGLHFIKDNLLYVLINWEATCYFSLYTYNKENDDLFFVYPYFPEEELYCLGLGELLLSGM